uniref:Uncharacterized protein n=1 Tax=Panagrolaimus sp. PS1159 TaxID=55785 RepID=A0AC35G023_9BILA
MKFCIVVLGLAILTAFCYGKAITKPTSLESDLNGKFDSVNSLIAETPATNPTTKSTTAGSPTITTTAKPERASKTPKIITQKINKKVLTSNLEELPLETKSEILSEYKQPTDITAVPRPASAPQQIQEATKEQNNEIFVAKTQLLKKPVAPVAPQGPALPPPPSPPQQDMPLPRGNYQPQPEQMLPTPPQQQAPVQTSIEELMIPKAQQDYVQSEQQQQTPAVPTVRWVYKPAKKEHNQESVPPPIGQGIVVAPTPQQQQQPKMESYHIQPEMPPLPLPQETLSMPQPPQTDQRPQVQTDILLPQQQLPQNYQPKQPEFAPQQTPEMPETPNFPPQILPQGLENQKPQTEFPEESPSQQQQSPPSKGQGEYRQNLNLLTPLASISMKRQM